METKLFTNRKGNKASVLEEEISHDRGETWEKTGNIRLDEDNIEYDSCDCSEEYRWELDGEITVDARVYNKYKLQIKYGCEDFKDDESGIYKIGDYLRDADDDWYEDDVFHKEEEGDIVKGDDGNCYQTYDWYIWYKGEWQKVNCDPIIGEQVECPDNI